MKSIRDVVREWFDDRPEYEREWPTSVAPLIANEVTMEAALASVQSSVVSAIGAIARGDGKNSVTDYDGRTVYVDPVDMPTLDGFITGYLQPQLRRAQDDVRRAWSRTCEWCRAHPEAGLSPQNVWKQADGPDWAVGL